MKNQILLEHVHAHARRYAADVEILCVCPKDGAKTALKAIEKSLLENLEPLSSLDKLQQIVHPRISPNGWPQL